MRLLLFCLPRLCVAVVLMLVILGHAAVQAQDAVAPAPPPLAWRNPVVAMDFADPSVARIGGVYWATATSSGHSPGLPLMRSVDLVHWAPAGTVFPRLPGWIADSLWAPELVADATGVRIYYAARRRGGRLCVAVASAPAPGGPYTDHGPLVCERSGSIDPTLVRDPSGTPFLIWKEDGNATGRPSRIWVRQLRPDGLGLVGPRREMLRNADAWEGAVVEAPEIVTRGGWLYLFYSGNSYGPAPTCRYALGVARSRTVFGPWQRDPANPILRSNRTWRCPGHASPVSDGTGRLFLMYHAYRASAAGPAPRLALLDAVDWSPAGWPVINGGRGPSRSWRTR